MGTYDDKCRFVNPYNFIPLMKKCERSVPEIRKDDCYTGYFDCSIKLLTPLFIPNTSSSERLVNAREKSDDRCKTEKWKGYDFFSYDDWSNEPSCESWPPLPTENPVIPGSEIRGAVRSVYEAAFNGCLSSVSVDRTLSRRSSEAKKPGILKQCDGKWFIQPCEKAMLYVVKEYTQVSERMGIPVLLNKYEHWEEGQEIWIKLNEKGFVTTKGSKSFVIGKVVKKYRIIKGSSLTSFDKTKEEERDRNKKEGYKQGWLHKGEYIHNKHHESVFFIDEDSKKSKQKIVNIPDADITGLEKVLDEYQDAVKNRMYSNKNAWYPAYKVDPKGTLVYYNETADHHFYLSPACIGREIFTKTIGDLLKNNGGYEPCAGKELCAACQIFGMLEKAEKSGTNAYGSKVRITDARLINLALSKGKLFEEPMILPEMGEPKPGAVEFYTKSPYTQAEKKDMEKPGKQDSGNGYWTYDYKCRYNVGNKKIDRQILCANQPELRGRKYYWHSEVDLTEYGETNNVSAMKQRIRPMKQGEWGSKPLFGFRVYFEHLSKMQLNQLKWALDFGNSDCAHKLGRAKPLGFGSTQMIVDAVHLRKIDAETGNWTVGSPELEQFFKDAVAEDEALETVRLMANWKERPENVRYPYVQPAAGSTKKNDGASHKWFTKNKGNISKPNFMKVLPEAKDEVIKDLNGKKGLYKLVERD